MIPKRFPSPDTPERCLAKLTTAVPTPPSLAVDPLSPPELESPCSGSSLSSSSTFRTSSDPSPAWSQLSASCTSTDPRTVRLPPSASPSPDVLERGASIPVSTPAERPGLGPRKLTKEAFGGSAAKLARELLKRSRPEVVGLDVEDRGQMNELMGMRAGRRACGESQVLLLPLPPSEMWLSLEGIEVHSGDRAAKKSKGQGAGMLTGRLGHRRTRVHFLTSRACLVGSLIHRDGRRGAIHHPPCASQGPGLHRQGAPARESQAGVDRQSGDPKVDESLSTSSESPTPLYMRLC